MSTHLAELWMDLRGLLAIVVYLVSFIAGWIALYRETDTLPPSGIKWD